jgi:flagellar capping protein FliD
MSSIQDIFRAGSVYEKLIDQLINLESSRKFKLEDQKTSQQTRKTAVTDVGSKISALKTLTTDYQDYNASQFNSLAPQSTNTDAFTVTNSGTLTASGAFNFEIQQLARVDVKVSSQLTAKFYCSSSRSRFLFIYIKCWG